MVLCLPRGTPTSVARLMSGWTLTLKTGSLSAAAFAVVIAALPTSAALDVVFLWLAFSTSVASSVESATAAAAPLSVACVFEPIPPIDFGLRAFPLTFAATS
ncbi:hypothetical protein HPB50_027390 [Hyalomma asiaticum]|uniref:Uncharacterized protein n=1 Tax=Hyalomma asiaticum TaxID=266040 RepID=A0ACB7RT98_HYAAI|nr:hypothetical protein HPB50_027390 [Hyalomma asiaticum]